MIYVLCNKKQRTYFIEYINSIGKYLPLQIVSNINDIKILENDMIWILQELDISLFESYKNKVYLINTEQNTRELHLSKLKSYPSNIKMIDYSLDNIRLYPRVNYYHIPYMVNLDEVYNYPKTKDIIMIGSGEGGCPKRANIASQLDSLVWFQNYFGPERDDQLFRHKILLNVHFAEGYKVLEEIRINRCIYNKMIVITEKGNHDYYELKDYFIECEYEDIVKVAKEVLANYDYYYNKLFANFDIIKIHSNHKRLIDEFLEKSSKNDRMDVVIAILVKDKEATLPRFITCLLNQTFPKERTRLYIRTNDNTDKSEEILSTFITEHTSKYKSVFYDRTSVSEELKQYKAHEWNAQRFKILGKIRDDSVKYAREHNAHYFVIDIDNFIVPSTLDDMLAVSSLGVIAPMLVTKSAYSNYHSSVDNNGYLKTDDLYLRILNKNIKGCIDVPVVHCTYFIANSLLDKVSYDDGSFRYEYVVFSDVLRKQNIPQYIDNRKDYGRITFATTKEEFEDDWAQYQSIFTQV